MSKKPKSPLAGKSRATLRTVRSVVTHYLDWRKDYLAGRAEYVITPYEMFTIGVGNRNVEANTAWAMEQDTWRWLEKHSTEELHRANERSRLRVKNRVAYEVAELHDEITAYLKAEAEKSAS